MGTLVLVRWGGFRLMISDSLGKLRFRRLPLVRLLGCSLIRLRSFLRRRWRVFGRSRFRRCRRCRCCRFACCCHLGRHRP